MNTHTKLKSALQESQKLKFRVIFTSLFIFVIWLTNVSIPAQAILTCIGVFWLVITIVKISKYSKLIKVLKELEELEQKQRVNDAYERYQKSGDINEMFNDLLNDILNKHFDSKYERKTFTKPNKDKLKNAYTLLRLSDSDSEDKIKKTYRTLAIKWHPDKWSTSTEQHKKIAGRNFRKLQNAYDLIKKDKNIN